MPIDARTLAARELKKEVVGIIRDTVARGVSPVKGFNAYKPYRPSTAKRKGRVRPVTLEETGRMMKSLTIIQKAKGRLVLFFKG